MTNKTEPKYKLSRLEKEAVTAMYVGAVASLVGTGLMCYGSITGNSETREAGKSLALYGTPVALLTSQLLPCWYACSGFR